MKAERLVKRNQLEFISADLDVASTFLVVAALTNDAQTRAESIRNAQKALTSAKNATRKLPLTEARAKLEETQVNLEERLRSLRGNRPPRVQPRRSTAPRRPGT